MKLVFILVLALNLVLGKRKQDDKSINMIDDRTYYNFSYVKDDVLNMNVILKNMTNGVTRYVLYYGTDLKKDKIKPGREIKVPISLKLIEETIDIKVKLYKKDMLCAHRLVARGMTKKYWTRTRNDDCLNKAPCSRPVDFYGKCIVRSSTGSVVDFYCEWQNIYPKEYILHQWLQFYNNELFIGTSPQTLSQKNKFTIKAESFDNNIDVNCRSSSLIGNRRTNDSMTRLYVVGNKTDDGNDFPLFRYSASKEFHFNCENYFQYTHFIQVGMINTTANKIKIFNDRSDFKIKFNMADNGTVLCCLFYIIEQDEDNVTHVIRRIENKKLLFYDESAGADGHTVTLYIIGVVAGALILLGILFYKKRYFKRKTEQTGLENEIEMETYYSTPNPVFYAELNMPTVAGRPNRPPEESPYAKVIGVLMPSKRKK